MDLLISAVQQLSLARDLESVMAIVRHTARELTGADGATFVLREGDLCYYADEEAITPLWKGQRFPIEHCISGWVMLNRRPAVIEDIYADARIPHDAYRPTFVKSLVMVPIRTMDPIGAIGNYWARRHLPDGVQVEKLQALADSTAIAVENVRVYQALEAKARELEELNRNLESFSYSVAHDLRAPLRAIDGYAGIVAEELGPALRGEPAEAIGRIHRNVAYMADLLDDLLLFARAGLDPNKLEVIPTGRVVEEVIALLDAPAAEFRIGTLADLRGDHALIRAVITHLLDNAVKFCRESAPPLVEINCRRSGEETVFSVKDNGIGFEPCYATRIFRLFERLHGAQEYTGTGVGLAMAQRIVHRHGGRIWAEGSPGAGATFSFALPN